MSMKTFSDTATILSSRLYPTIPTREQAQALLVEMRVHEPSERMIDDLLEETQRQYAFWKREEDYEGACESAEARRTELDYT